MALSVIAWPQGPDPNIPTPGKEKQQHAGDAKDATVLLDTEGSEESWTEDLQAEQADNSGKGDEGASTGAHTPVLTCSRLLLFLLGLPLYDCSLL